LKTITSELNLKIVTISKVILVACLAIFIAFANQIRVNISNLKVSDYSKSELLINYQGGFVRRGLIGEIAYQTNSPIHTVTLLQKGALLFIFLGLLAIIVFEKSNFSRIAFTCAIIFAPGGLNDLEVGGAQGKEPFEYLDRKEIWFYVALIIFYFLIKFFGKNPKTLSLLFTPIAILTILIHEMFALFALSIFSIWLFTKKIKLKSSEFNSALIFYLPVFISIFFVTKYHGNQQTAESILQSYAIKFPGLDINGQLGPTEGALPAIGWDFAKSHEMAMRIVTLGSSLYYIFFAAMSLVFVNIYALIKFNKLSHLSLSIILNLFIFLELLVTTYFFMDTGRLISMYTISSLIGINCLSESIAKAEITNNSRYLGVKEVKKDTRFRILFLILMSYFIFIALITRVEHSNPQINQIPLSPFFGILK